MRSGGSEGSASGVHDGAAAGDARPGGPVVAAAAVSASGVAYAVAAYGIWGVTPVYWKALEALPAPELLAWRVLWSALLGAALLGATGRTGELRAALGTPRQALPMALSAALIAGNWLTFIWAVQVDRVVHTSLGYYVNPLVSVALGFAVLRERLRPGQWGAVAIAGSGVGWWTLQLGGLPWVSAVLAGTFAAYGLVRKLAPVAPLAGFALETLYLAPVAAVWLAGRALAGEDLALAGAGPGLHALVALSGVITAAPLVLFASAARRLPLSRVGLFQYLAPSLALVIAVALFGEPFTRDHAVTFGCVWLALAIFSVDSLRARPGRPATLR